MSSAKVLYKVGDYMPPAPPGWEEKRAPVGVAQAVMPAGLLANHKLFVNFGDSRTLLASVENVDDPDGTGKYPALHCSLSSLHHAEGMPDDEVIEVLEQFFGAPLKVAEETSEFWLSDKWIEMKSPLSFNKRVRHFMRIIRPGRREVV